MTNADYISGNGDIQWCFSQVKGTLDDDVTEGKFLKFRNILYMSFRECLIIIDGKNNKINCHLV